MGLMRNSVFEKNSEVSKMAIVATRAWPMMMKSGWSHRSASQGRVRLATQMPKMTRAMLLPTSSVATNCCWCRVKTENMRPIIDRLWASRSMRTLLAETKATPIPEKKKDSKSDMTISVDVIFSERISVRCFWDCAKGCFWASFLPRSCFG